LASEIRPRALACALLALSLASPMAAAHKAHTHGVGDLDVAVDGGRISLALTVPAADVVGFEHAPRTDAQREAVASAEKLLRAQAELFALPVAARCRFLSADVTAPWSGDAGAADAEHSDFAARWEFDCAEPAQLAFIEVRIAAKLSGDLKLRATVLDERGQRRAELTRSRTRLALR
jgi:hypothetical protein